MIVAEYHDALDVSVACLSLIAPQSNPISIEFFMTQPFWGSCSAVYLVKMVSEMNMIKQVQKNEGVFDPAAVYAQSAYGTRLNIRPRRPNEGYFK